MTIEAVRDNCTETRGINDVKGVNVELTCTVTVLPGLLSGFHVVVTVYDAGSRAPEARDLT